MPAMIGYWNRERARALGGHLVVTGSQGRGTTFAFSVPMAARAGEPLELASLREQSAGSSISTSNDGTYDQVKD
jgi:hypothetical protein